MSNEMEALVIESTTDDEKEEDEEDVVIITPQKRKGNKRRRSVIQEEDEEDDEEPPQLEELAPTAASFPRQTATAMVSSQEFARTQSLSQALDQQLQSKQEQEEQERQEIEMPIGDDEEDAEAHQQQQQPQRAIRAEELDEEEEDDDDDIRIGSSAKKKNARLTIFDSEDEEEQPEVDAEQQQMPADKQQRVERTPDHRRQTDDQAHSTGRRSSQRLATLQREKISTTSARKLVFGKTLDNCLDGLRNHRKSVASDDNEEEQEEEDEEEDDDDEVEPVRRSRYKRQRTREVEREGRYADGGEDLDDFVVSDNEIEYMDDDEESVIVDTASSDEGEQDEETKEAEAQRVLESMRSRETDEWFSIYLTYIEECVLDENFDFKMQHDRTDNKYELYQNAIRHIERSLCSRRDNLMGNIRWPRELLECLQNVASVHSRFASASAECFVCQRANHPASWRMHFSGLVYPAKDLYRGNWMKMLRRAVSEGETKRESFLAGSVCYQRTLAYWQLLHAKYYWTVLVDEMIQKFHGRIPEEERTKFHKREYSRFRKLFNVVDYFSCSGDHRNTKVMNMWKAVTLQDGVNSTLLVDPHAGVPSPKTRRRRGQVDEEFVGDSDDNVSEEEEEDDDEEGIEGGGGGQGQTANNVIDDEEDEDEDDPVIIDPPPPPTTQPDSPPREPLQASSRANENLYQMDDDKCLLCRQRQRNGAVVHGNYMHVYCCYQCGKRQLATKKQEAICLVCHRPIDRLVEVLPLSASAKRHIAAQARNNHV